MNSFFCITKSIRQKDFIELIQLLNPPQRERLQARNTEISLANSDNGSFVLKLNRQELEPKVLEMLLAEPAILVMANQMYLTLDSGVATLEKENQ